MISSLDRFSVASPSCLVLLWNKGAYRESHDPAIDQSNLAIRTALICCEKFIGSAHSGSRFAFTNNINFPQMFSIVLNYIWIHQVTFACITPVLTAHRHCTLSAWLRDNYKILINLFWLHQAVMLFVYYNKKTMYSNKTAMVCFEEKSAFLRNCQIIFNVLFIFLVSSTVCANTCISISTLMQFFLDYILKL